MKKYMVVYQKKLNNRIAKSIPVGVITASSLEVASDLVFKKARNKMILNKGEALLILPKSEAKKYLKYHVRPNNATLIYLVDKKRLSG